MFENGIEFFNGARSVRLCLSALILIQRRREEVEYITRGYRGNFAKWMSFLTVHVNFPQQLLRRVSTHHYQETAGRARAYAYRIIESQTRSATNGVSVDRFIFAGYVSKRSREPPRASPFAGATYGERRSWSLLMVRERDYYLRYPRETR